MAKRERVIAKCIGGDVRLIPYEESGRLYTDLLTDGRVLLSPATARQIARKLVEWATKVEAADAGR